MKPAAFEYYAPTTLEEALASLAQHGWDAKVLAGGQSLIPLLNFRLAQPSVLVDLNNVSELFYVHPSSDGGLRVGGGRHEIGGACGRAEVTRASRGAQYRGAG